MSQAFPQEGQNSRLQMRRCQPFCDVTVDVEGTGYFHGSPRGLDPTAVDSSHLCLVCSAARFDLSSEARTEGDDYGLVDI